MDRRLLIIVNVAGIAIAAWLAVIALTDFWEPVVAPGVVRQFSLGLLLIVHVILVALGYIDIRKRLFDFAFKGKKPADSGLFRFLRLLLMVANVITVLLVVLFWIFVRFYMPEQLAWAVIVSGFVAAPVICINLLLFLRDCIVVRETPAG